MLVPRKFFRNFDVKMGAKMSLRIAMKIHTAFAENEVSPTAWRLRKVSCTDSC